MNRSVIDLVQKLKATNRGDWQYLEVKQMAEVLACQRQKLRISIANYRAHKDVLAITHDAIEKLYLGYEGMFMRDHLRDAIRLYLLANRDYHEVCIDQTPTYRRNAA